MSEPGTNQFLQTNDTTQTAQMLPPDQTNPQLAVAAEEGMNPGAATYTRPSMKVPPTRKDDRKLFVGGLPANSKFKLASVPELRRNSLLFTNSCPQSPARSFIASLSSSDL